MPFDLLDSIRGGGERVTAEMLVLRADERVQRTEQTVQTWVKWDAIRNGLRDRYRSGMKAGLTPDEIHRQITDDGNLAAWS